MQYITYLEAKDSHKNIKKGFVWDNIPQFAVITGENGSGKSSLLEQIDISSKANALQKKIFDIPANLRVKYEKDFVMKVQNIGTMPSSYNNLLVTRRKLRNLNDTNPYVGLLKYIQNRESFAFQDFVRGNYPDPNNQAEVDNINGWRKNFFKDMEIYKSFLERNGMSTEDFLLEESEDELEKWFQKLDDSNVESSPTLFDEQVILTNLYLFHKKFDDIKRNFEKDEINAKATIAEIVKMTNDSLEGNPIDEVNVYLEKYLKYKLEFKSEGSMSQALVFRSTQDSQKTVSFQDLSWGEQVILSFLVWRYKKTTLDQVVFLLDEPDAHLNPKMAQMLIDVLKNVIVKEFGCQVIMTTHTLSTVAQCDEGELFYMEDGKIEEIEKMDCMEKLSGGVLIEEMKNILEAVIESSKVVFVEGESDKLHIEKFFQITNCTNPPFRVFDSKSATKMQHYAKAISTLKPTLGNKCLFLCDDDGEGRKAEAQVKQYNIKTMLVSQGQKHAGGNFTIENCYDNSLIKACNQNQTSSWSSKTKIQFAQQTFSRNDMQGIQILVDEIKKYL